MKRNERPVWLTVFIGLSLSGVLSVLAAVVGRVIALAIELELLLKFLG